MQKIVFIYTVATSHALEIYKYQGTLTEQINNPLDHTEKYMINSIQYYN